MVMTARSSRAMDGDAAMLSRASPRARRDFRFGPSRERRRLAAAPWARMRETLRRAQQFSFWLGAMRRIRRSRPWERRRLAGTRAKRAKTRWPARRRRSQGDASIAKMRTAASRDRVLSAADAPVTVAGGRRQAEGEAP